MKQLIALFKDNRFFRTAIIFGVLFLILVLVLSPKKNSSLGPLPSPIAGATSTQNRPELSGMEADKLKKSSDYRSLISDRLPLKIDELATSVGITTNINIFYLPDDPPSILRFEIYGISYLNKDSTPLTNPNIVAFQESFKEGLKQMENIGIDPKQLIFIYGDVEYVRETASAWVDKLGLLK